MKNPARFVLVNSPVQADILFRPAVIYQLKRHGKVVLELWFYPFERRLEAILEGGISIKGPILPMDLHVYDYGKEVAKLEPAPELSAASAWGSPGRWCRPWAQARPPQAVQLQEQPACSARSRP